MEERLLPLVEGASEMATLHRVITDFGDAEVRRKSQSILPPFFREWPSVDPEVFLHPTDWKKLRRRVNVVGYPRLDIFSEWIMDFASISAYQLGRSDWRNFRRLILIHVPDCPMFCWYCFNDAWLPSKPPEGCEANRGTVTVGEETADNLVNAFENYRASIKAHEGQQVNVLRLSGGEPFTQPQLVTDLATVFRARYGNGNSCFLWVDTNLALIGHNPEQHEETIKALRALGRQAAVHACLHGADDASLKRNTHRPFHFTDILSGLELFAHSGIEVYPRINPVGLTAPEAESIFEALVKIKEDLPARTYLGPVELHYESAIDRMRIFQGRKPVYNSGARALNPDEPGMPAEYRPTNAVIYAWNRLMEATYGVGYGVVPRHLASSIKRLVPAPRRRERKTWKEAIIVTKGWEKEAYAEKLLELLALPPDCVIDIEYENKWIEPSFVAHLYAAGSYYTGKDVLFIAAIPPRGQSPGKIIPLRWGTVQSASCDAVDKRQSVTAKVIVGRYAVDFAPRFIGDDKSTAWDRLAKYVGEANLPFGSPQGYFCEFVGLELGDACVNESDSDFKSIVLGLTDSPYSKAKRDVFYRIRAISQAAASELQQPGAVPEKAANAGLKFQSGVLHVFEGDEVFFSIEACNPNLGNEGFPAFSQMGIAITSTHPESVIVAPKEIKLSKYGTVDVRVRFPRRGDFEGMLMFSPVDTGPRIAELRIPFRVQIRSEDDE